MGREGKQDGKEMLRKINKKFQGNLSHFPFLYWSWAVPDMWCVRKVDVYAVFQDYSHLSQGNALLRA